LDEKILDFLHAKPAYQNQQEFFGIFY